MLGTFTENEESLIENVAEKLDERSETVSSAESATGGLVGNLLTDVPGASTYFECAVVTYSNRSKQQLTGVSKETLHKGTAVGRDAAMEMCRGVRDLSQTDWGISVTGYAGPGSGEEKPEGVVFIGVAYSGNNSQKPFSKVNRYVFEGSREEKKRKFALQALGDLHGLIDRLE